MSDRVPRPQRVLPETAEALRETGDLIDVADDAMDEDHRHCLPDGCRSPWQTNKTPKVPA